MTAWEAIKYRTLFKGAAGEATKTLFAFADNGERGDGSLISLANLKKALTDENVTKLFNGLGTSNEVCNHKDWVARSMLNCANNLPDSDMPELLTFLEKDPVAQATLNVPPNSRDVIKNTAQTAETIMEMIKEKADAFTPS